MLHDLTDYWSVDVPSEFTTRQTDDGFQLFQKRNVRILLTVYLHQPFDGHSAIRRWRSRKPLTDGVAIPFLDQSEHGKDASRLAALGMHFTRSPGGALIAAVAAFGEVVDMYAEYQDAADFDTVCGVWRSIDHAAPPWVWACGAVEPALEKLAEALLSGWDADEAVEEIRNRGQISEAFAILAEGLTRGSTDERIRACGVIELLERGDSMVVQQLRACIESNSDSLRDAASRALRAVGE